MDPQGIGVSPLMIKYFNSFPMPNDTSVGDGVNYEGYRFKGSNLTSFNWYIARAYALEMLRYTLAACGIYVAASPARRPRHSEPRPVRDWRAPDWPNLA